MKTAKPARLRRCAIYTRKSSEEGLEQAFNSLDAQREACEAYITSQAHEGWQALPEYYDDGGFSGGNVERPALKALLAHIRAGDIDLVIVYKVDRLSRSLADFVRLIELLDEHDVSFVSVTQQFNTAHSMGRLTLNVLLSFAQFEREVTSERIRDKIAASKKKGMWMGGTTPLGYNVVEKKLVINAEEAQRVNRLFDQYLKLKSVRNLKAWVDKEGLISKQRQLRSGKTHGGVSFTRSSLYTIIKNPIYIGKIRHQSELYDGQHPAIVDKEIWERAQKQIETNRIASYQRSDAKNPSLLSGLIFDDNNNAMSPCHTQRSNLRFRYYVSQALLKYKESEAGSVQRVPAESIERAILDELGECLDSPYELFEPKDIEQLTVSMRERIGSESRRLQTIFAGDDAHQQIPLLQQLVDRVVVNKHSIQIQIESINLTALFDLPEPARPNTIERNIAATLRRTGIGKRLVIKGKPEKAHSRSIEALQRATLSALNVNQALLTGAVDSIKTMAKLDNTDERNLGHLLKLAFLSPDTIMRIVKGDIAVEDDLQLTALKQRKSPLIWR